MDKLKPCPFCGSVAEINKTDDGGFFVECGRCGSCTVLVYNEMDSGADDIVSDKWNTRHEETTVCPECVGRGEIVNPEADVESELAVNCGSHSLKKEWWIECHTCHGTGTIPTDKDQFTQAIKQRKQAEEQLLNALIEHIAPLLRKIESLRGDKA